MNDVLQILQAFETSGLLTLAFAAWAIVVWRLGRAIINKLDSLQTGVNKSHFYLSNRITKVEGHLENKDEGFRPYRNGSTSGTS